MSLFLSLDVSISTLGDADVQMCNESFSFLPEVEKNYFILNTQSVQCIESTSHCVETTAHAMNLRLTEETS